MITWPNYLSLYTNWRKFYWILSLVAENNSLPILTRPFPRRAVGLAITVVLDGRHRGHIKMWRSTRSMRCICCLKCVRLRTTHIGQKETWLRQFVEKEAASSMIMVSLRCMVLGASLLKLMARMQLGVRLSRFYWCSSTRKCLRSTSSTIGLSRMSTHRVMYISR